MSSELNPVTVSESAIALGNPSTPGGLHPRLEPVDDLIVVSLEFSTSGYIDHSSTIVFEYQSDVERFNSGKLIYISYTLNDDEPECLENTLLYNKDYMDFGVVKTSVIPAIQEMQSVNWVTMKTVNGVLTVLPDVPREAPPYPPIPELPLPVPTVAISELRLWTFQVFHPHVDVVTIAGDPSGARYVFKHYTVLREPSEAGLTAELQSMCRVESRYIIRPSFIVADASEPDSTSFRGFLIPFCPAGRLVDVIARLHNGGAPGARFPPQLVLAPSAPEDENAEPFGSFYEEPKDTGFEVVPFVLSARRLRWSIKHTWAVEAAIAVADLHAADLLTGDLKLVNILLDTKGSLCFIDIDPTNGYTEQYAPPELAGTAAAIELTEARDVFALGLILWQIVEEVHQFNRKGSYVPPLLVWWDGEDATPQWFQDIVEECIKGDTKSRPSARRVLEVLSSALVVE